jgi:uncharacterized HAD superfamily protein
MTKDSNLIYLAGERQLRIGLDIDGVVADSFPCILRKMNEFFGKDLATIVNYNMAELYVLMGNNEQIF